MWTAIQASPRVLVAAWILRVNECSVCCSYPEHWYASPNAVWLPDVAGWDGAGGDLNAV